MIFLIVAIFHSLLFFFSLLFYSKPTDTRRQRSEKKMRQKPIKKIFENLLAFMEICIDIMFWLVDCAPNKTTIHAYAHGFTVTAFTGIPVSTMLAYPSKSCKTKTRIYDGYEIYKKKYKTRTESFGLFQYKHKFKFWAINYEKKTHMTRGK